MLSGANVARADAIDAYAIPHDLLGNVGREGIKITLRRREVDILVRVAELRAGQ
jgi:hypothetical protein